jgi:prophage regulatory protein
MPKQAQLPQPGALQSAAFLRERQLIKGPERLLPFSSATLWRKVNAGDFPKPVKLGPGITAWRAADVAAWVAARGAA